MTKQRIVARLRGLRSLTSIEPGSTLIQISPALSDAIGEIEEELAKHRTDWHLVAALMGVKSYICSGLPLDPARNRFWEIHPEGWDCQNADAYRILDGLHFEACSRIGRMPSGITVFSGGPSGISMTSGEVETDASPISPTLRMIDEERTWIREKYGQ